MSLPEIVLVLVLALIVFGPDRIPKVARTVGRTIREMRRAASEVRRTLDIEDVRRDLRQRNLARERAKKQAAGASGEQASEATDGADSASAAAAEGAASAVGADAGELDENGSSEEAPSPAADRDDGLPSVRPPRHGVAADGAHTAPTSAGPDDEEGETETEGAAPVDPELEARLEAEDRRLERELRAFLGLAPSVNGTLRRVALPPRNTPAGGLTDVALAARLSLDAESLTEFPVPLRTRSS